ncbi:MAG: N-acetyltransferase [Streptococcaceae bacterium]|jgi:predicted GNAT family acetyltransferase|nr:N-acetyltransferase [Streptococcaceae bacterium]
MNIREEDRRLVLYNDNNPFIGEITWLKTENVLIIDHTFVESEFGGQGYARQLVDALVQKARDKNLKLLPVCSYAKRVLIEPKYEDVLKK